MPARSKKKSGKNSGAVDRWKALALDVLKIAVPVSKAIPLVGNTLEGALEAVLYIIEVKDQVKTKREQCDLLADRVLSITAAITTELMKSDRETLARRENSVASLRGTLREVKDLLDHLTSVSLIQRVLERGEVDGKLAVLNQKLNTAIDNFNITEHMRSEETLNQLREAVQDMQNKQNILLLNSLLQPVTSASFHAHLLLGSMTQMAPRFFGYQV
ncbi:hypothetical protein MIND_00419900 [Mycena indigotica]|uniref:Mixed lineage kinase domain-containing protein n=1 Tax=Mycena indigotica TaxID=2126181 RepID=A0A8H6SVS9_9AGAR|nr:uncharacterized protein MIND_00419900 [Mycena indigotica]KAF7306289.1 hypothetical protein MIND_00419900 [Mycena indigotica]